MTTPITLPYFESALQTAREQQAKSWELRARSHRWEITALFCDLRDFTGFSESSDPEDVMETLARLSRGAVVRCEAAPRRGL